MTRQIPLLTLAQAEPAAQQWRRTATVRRALVMLVILGQTLVATYFMLWVLPYHGSTYVELGMVVLFGLLFAWISVGFWIGVLGFYYRRRAGIPCHC